jgi:hypothetical protein
MMSRYPNGVCGLHACYASRLPHPNKLADFPKSNILNSLLRLVASALVISLNEKSHRQYTPSGNGCYAVELRGGRERVELAAGNPTYSYTKKD